MTERYKCQICGDIFNLQWGDNLTQIILEHIMATMSKHLAVLDKVAFEKVGIYWIGMMTDETVRIICDKPVTIHQINKLKQYDLYLYRISPLVDAFKLEFTREEPTIE